MLTFEGEIFKKAAVPQDGSLPVILLLPGISCIVLGLVTDNLAVLL